MEGYLRIVCFAFSLAFDVDIWSAGHGYLLGYVWKSCLTSSKAPASCRVGDHGTQLKSSVESVNLIIGKPQRTLCKYRSYLPSLSIGEKIYRIQAGTSH